MKAKRKSPRRQCAKCPWKKNVNPFDIPDGYCPAKHAALSDTIAEPGTIHLGDVKVMACHESYFGKEKECVGWLANQMGDGNNISVRIMISQGRIDANVKTVGPQHERFEDTLP